MGTRLFFRSPFRKQHGMVSLETPQTNLAQTKRTICETNSRLKLSYFQLILSRQLLQLKRCPQRRMGR